MTGRRLIVLAALVAAAGCASGVMWLTDHPVIDDYATARVRIYRAGRECRVEIMTPANTIITLPTRCLVVPHRQTP
jgi:hypothetical protein